MEITPTAETLTPRGCILIKRHGRVRVKVQRIRDRTVKHNEVQLSTRGHQRCTGRDKAHHCAYESGQRLKLQIIKSVELRWPYFGTQPNVNKIFLLVRAADTKAATERFHNEVLGKELFRVVREKWGSNLNSLISEKVLAIPGDISCDNLGVKDPNLREEMWREIDVILNSAATTKFDERYDAALGINTLGARHVVTFAKKCVKLKMLLHVSTDFYKYRLILENPFFMGETLNETSGLDIEGEVKLMGERLSKLRTEGATEDAITSAMKDLGINRARLYGWPNTYVFTKAMGEMLLGHLRENLPLVIIRPTIITTTYKEPFPGWIEGFRTIDSIVISYAKGKLSCFLGNVKSILDAIPADMVVNLIFDAMVVHASQSSEIIYHVGSSMRNPLKLLEIRDYSFRHFTKNPWIKEDGKPVKVGKVTMLSNMASFHRYMAIHCLLPLKVCIRDHKFN
ncbi:hypothetical protein L1049_027245 [Liquidambar formosana]|uniref:Fatty acyl-CoA reductase n=1 Tax=Liquidambar formosana TaxID=63359 RepID=A0AAP0N6U0_LIQFO